MESTLAFVRSWWRRGTSASSASASRTFRPPQTDCAATQSAISKGPLRCYRPPPRSLLRSVNPGPVRPLIPARPNGLPACRRARQCLTVPIPARFRRRGTQSDSRISRAFKGSINQPLISVSSGPQGRGRFVATPGVLAGSRALMTDQVRLAARLRRAVPAEAGVPSRCAIAAGRSHGVQPGDSRRYRVSRTACRVRVGAVGPAAGVPRRKNRRRMCRRSRPATPSPSRSAQGPRSVPDGGSAPRSPPSGTPSAGAPPANARARRASRFVP